MVFLLNGFFFSGPDWRLRRAIESGPDGNLVVPITSTRSKVSDAILFTVAKGSTPLIDGVYLALQRLRRAHHSRRALIAISDGQDNSSRYTERELRALAIESSTQIYTVGLFHSDPMLDNSGRDSCLISRSGPVAGVLKFSPEGAGPRLIGFG